MERKPRNYDNEHSYKLKNDILKSRELTNISKSLSLILRHKAKDFGLEIEPSGFVKLEDLLQIGLLKKKNVTLELINEVVEKDDKGRYEIINRPPMFIRAIQGHSLTEVKTDESLDSLDNYYEFPTVVHGTYNEFW